MREITTDASGSTGYGVAAEGLAAGANWAPTWNDTNIALKELYAVQQAIITQPATFQHRQVVVWTDN